MLIHRNLARASIWASTWRFTGNLDRYLNPSSPRRRGPIRRSLSSKQFGPIPPIQVVFFNQPNLPVAIPFLEMFFAGNRLIRRVKPFHMNKSVHSVFLRECIGSARTMLTEAAGQVVRDTNGTRCRVDHSPECRRNTLPSTSAGGYGSPPPRGRQFQLLFPVSDFSLIPVSVAVGVIASGSILRWRIDGLPDARAAANAAGKSALFSTSAP